MVMGNDNIRLGGGDEMSREWLKHCKVGWNADDKPGTGPENTCLGPNAKGPEGLSNAVYGLSLITECHDNVVLVYKKK